MGTSGLAAAILNFGLPVSRCSFPDSADEFLDTENTGVAVGISFLGAVDPVIHWE
jgi:hypothetical protein